MNALWYYAIGFIVVWILAFILKGKFDNISVEGFVLMLKTDKLEHLIDKIASWSPRFWKYYINISIPLGIFFMVLMLVSLFISLQMMFETPTVSLILPGVDIPGSPIYIPFATGLIALATVLIIHEGGHGVLARAEGIPIDSVGLLLFAIIPGAFVEPNQEELDKVNGFSRLRVYFAGPMFNMGLCAVALIITLLLSGAMAGMYVTDGIEIDSVVPSSPSDGVLESGIVIKSINNVSTHNSKEYVGYLSTNHVGDNLTIVTDRGTYSIQTSSNPNNQTQSYIGVRSHEHKAVSESAKRQYGSIIPAMLPTLHEICYLIFFLNFAVGTFNLLPMKPLDGGLILEEILKTKITPSRRKEFNSRLNSFTRFLPMSIRCFISRCFNSILNFISKHELRDDTVGKITKWLSMLCIFILVLLIVYGFVPAIMSMF